MTTYIDIDMDICESSHSYDDMEYYQPRCSLDEGRPSERLSEVRCVSIESESSNKTIGTDGDYSDFFEDYDIYPTILGTGGYGCVRECLHRASGEKYAVKTIDKSKIERLDHIQREISLLGSMNHPGVMKMVDFYEDADYVHIVTEKYTGGDLFDEIVNNTTDYGCLDEDQAVKIIRALLEAVQYLHANDIVHRDIKPENVMFEDEEGSSIKLIDFGLSRVHMVNEPAMANQVGTPYYMSPDVLQGKYDRSCDLWSIGVVAYILLTGYPPFNGNSNFEVLESIRKGNLVFEESIWGNVSKSSRDFVSKMLSFDSSSRIRVAEDALRHPWMANQ
jgi:serine/threonine protein kinase